MSIRGSGKALFTASILAAVAATVFAQNRLVIDVSKSNPPPSNQDVIFYGGTGSVRNSDERSYQAAQERRSTATAQSREEGSAAEARRVGGAESRRSTSGAGERRSGEATARHGSVRLDTIR